MSSPSFRTALVEQFVLGFFADEVHRRHGDPPDQLAVVIDHRGRDEVVTLEGLGGGFGFVGGSRVRGCR